MTPEIILVGVLQALLLLLAAPLFSGFARVMRAKLQNRKGPPVMQNYLDIVKLMKRQEVVSEQAGWIFTITPYLSMACMLLAGLIIPVLWVQGPAGMVGDVILLFYLFALPRLLFSLAGLESGSPFGGVGVRRELFVTALVKPSLMLIVFVMALIVGSTNLGVISSHVATAVFPFSVPFWLNMAAFALATFIEMGKLPFDLAEAEQELQEGPLAEYSGRSLAIYKWSIYLKQLVLVALFLALFVPFGAVTNFSRGLGLAAAVAILLAAVFFLFKAFLFYFVAAVLENAMARTRFIKVPAVTWLALGAAVLSLVFYLANV